MHKHFKTQLAKYKLDALYITDPLNIKYLTGFDGSFSVVIITNDEFILVTDSRYYEEAKEKYKDVKVIEINNKIWEDVINKSKIMAFESRNMTVERFEKLTKKFVNTKWVPAFPIIENMRRQKNAFEIQAIKKACHFADNALDILLKIIAPGDAEIDMAWQLEKIAREEGAEALAFSPIVAFEENAAIPHHKPSHKKLKSGDTILIDFGVKYHGYCSDMTRTFFFQHVSAEKAKVYELVLNAHNIGIQNLQEHRTCHEVYDEVLNYFKKYRLDKYFIHSLGHGVGLNIHEMPSIALNSKETLNEWEIVTCEPGLYFPHKFGIRIEDVGVIKFEGFESFNQTSKVLRVID